MPRSIGASGRRYRMLAYQRNQNLSECAAEVLDKASAKWSVDRIG